MENLSVKVLGTHEIESERTMSTRNTTVVPPLIAYLHPNGVMRVGCEPGATSCAVDEKQFPENQEPQ